ncbi:hypothetical protein EX30DRAFT_12244 [Ascodesmis nigricans]|uniref:ribonuclease Z n=1 Tax=Ascodesmis nigricans TaxID=341454 RepID=A0A4S2N6G3_9PEZI|nr:hypothetical protein EX30DRAFT_12244 [Ascodesmis nigricans]
MRVWAELLSTPTADTPGTCVQVHFDDRRYILGHIAEGTQRWLTERKSRGGKLSDVFITGRTEWATTGGLIGFILTLSDQKKDKRVFKWTTVHGGENLLHMVASTRSYVLREQMLLKVDEQVEGITPPFQDHNVTVTPLYVRPTGDPLAPVPPSPKLSPAAGEKRERDESMSRDERIQFLAQKVKDMFFKEQQSVNKTGNEGKEGAPKVNEVGEPPMKKGRGAQGADTLQPSQAQSEMLPPGEPSNIALSYILIMNDHRGKFLPKVAISLGVRPGPDFAKLASGEAVMGKTGNMVKPEDVMEPTRIGAGIAVCDIPEACYIDDFLSKPEWSNTEKLQKRLSCFFWILGDGLQEDKRILEFMEKFPEASHVVSSRELCANHIRFTGAAKFTQRLNYLDPVCFPLLQSSLEPAKPAPEGTLAARSGMRRILEPEWIWEERFDREFDGEKALESVRALGPSFDEVVTDIHQSLASDPVPAETWPGSDAEVITLGTGSSLPSRYRNVSGTLLRVPGVGSIIIDCGEDTYGQLRRLLPPDELEAVMFDLKVIYISHLHADHHLGAVSLIKERTKLLLSKPDPNNNTIFIVAPHRFHNFLDEYSSVEKIFSSHANRQIYVPLESLIPPPYTTLATPQNRENLKQLLDSLSLSSWRAQTAYHCQDAFTTAFTFKNGFKVAYSGDTRPTHRFTLLGRDATLLIHEATFDDELLAEAVAKRHSTISEAIEAGMQMKAKVTCLTHFSQRYPKKPKMVVGEGGDMDVVYAFDSMRFRVGEAARFRRLQKGLEEVYKDVDEDAMDAEEEGREEEEEEEVKEEVKPVKEKKGKKEKQQQQQQQQKLKKSETRRERTQRIKEEDRKCDESGMSVDAMIKELQEIPKRKKDEKKKEGSGINVDAMIKELMESPKKQKEMGKQEARVMQGRRDRLRRLDSVPDEPEK